ncbi:MAG: hypothetical protein IVW51_17920 [Thermaceae bacterium]|nr:hypothetical protein [Thermaceae bacterium]
MIAKPLSRTLVALTAAAAAAVFSACSSAATTSTTPVISVPSIFTTLDGPGGSPTTFNGLSNTNTIAGFTTNNGINSNFTRSSSGTFTPLNLGDPAGSANAVNNLGTVVGVANGNAFMLSGGKQTTLTPPGSSASVAFGINDLGTIVGQYTSGATSPGFVYANGTFTTINVPTAMQVFVQGINNNGLAIGFYSPDGTHQHGFTYNTKNQQLTLLPDPSTSRITTANPLVLTQFLGLNDYSEAVGYYQTQDGSQYGFVFNLATNVYSFVDDPNAAPVKGVQITQITGVSNTAQVTGFFIDANGVQHGFFATPAN